MIRKKLKKTLFNHIVRKVVDVWHKVNKYLNDPSFLSRFSPIWGYNYFRPGRADAGFDMWADKRVKQIKDVLDRSGTFLTFEGLVNKFVVPRKLLKKCLQLRSFIKPNNEDYSFDVREDSYQRYI